MHARVSAMTGDPGQVDAATTMLETDFYARLEQVDGFRAVIALAQRNSGKSLVLTFWDSEEAMAASEERAGQMRSEAATELGAGAPEVERFEVLFYKALKK